MKVAYLIGPPCKSTW